MKTIDLPYFGLIEINIEKDEQDYLVDIILNNTSVELNLIYVNENVSIKDLGIVKNFLVDLKIHSSTAKKAILHDYMNDGQSKDFIQLHIDTLTENDKNLLEAKNVNVSENLLEFFLGELSLAFIYLFPDSDEDFIKMSFILTEEFFDEILFVRFDKQLEIKEIAFEY